MKKINPDITEAKTLEGNFYCSDQIFSLVKEKIFESSWQFICSKDEVDDPDTVLPFYLLENFISEPLLLLNNNNQINCFSNVCTHRGNILVEEKTKIKKILSVIIMENLLQKMVSFVLCLKLME